MGVGYRYRLQAQMQTVDTFDNSLRIVSWIDTDCFPCFFTGNDARVLLESCYGDLFYEHELCSLYLVLCALLRFASKSYWQLRTNNSAPNELAAKLKALSTEL
jgi:hypothetical protein